MGAGRRGTSTLFPVCLGSLRRESRPRVLGGCRSHTSNRAHWEVLNARVYSRPFAPHVWHSSGQNHRGVPFAVENVTPTWPFGRSGAGILLRQERFIGHPATHISISQFIEITVGQFRGRLVFVVGSRDCHCSGMRCARRAELAEMVIEGLF